METIQGTWINEISEMQAMEKSEVNAVKAFLSKTTDYYRAAYGRYVSEKQRQCVFFGTTNSKECLRDTTGGRRFWPIEIDKQERKKNVFEDLGAERDLIWAEAVQRYKEKEPLHLPSDIEEVARQEQEEHREKHAWEGLIEEFIERKIPADWSERSLENRMIFWSGYDRQTDIELIERDRVCVYDIWCEALGQHKGNINQRVSREINTLLEKLDGWENKGVRQTGNAYGKQRVFVKKSNGNKV